MRVEHDLEMRTRDGVRLVADVYRPDDDAPHPVIMQRTPYGKRNALYLHGTGIDAIAAVERGYAVVSQDCRGRFGSDGLWRPFRHEADDGYDTVEWVAGRPWCNGRVGIWGCSYMGTTALQAAVAAPPHLSAVLAYMAGPSPYRGWAYTEGAFELGFATFWTTRGAWETLRRADLDPDRRAELTARLHDITARPLRDIADLPVADLGGIEELIPFWADWLAHPELDEFWQAVDVALRAGEIRCPVLHVTGVGDNLVAGHVELNAALAEHPDEAVRASHRFVLGPWDHESYQTSRPSASGQVDFGPQARNGLALNDALGREWFDHWLLDADAPLTMPRAQFFCSGEDRWRTADQWPPEHTELAQYLASDGAAHGSAGDGRLSTAPADTPADTFAYDPRDPVPSVGGRTLSPVFGSAGVQDQRAVAEREDVLVYTGEPLAADLIVAGRPRLVLHAGTDGPTTDFTGKVVDVEPDGFCRNVAEGIVRLRGTAEGPITIDLQAIGHTFRAGHRIRVEVASSLFPHFSRNLNGPERPEHGEERDIRVAQQTVYHDTGRPSRIVLPVVAADHLKVPRCD